MRNNIHRHADKSREHVRSLIKLISAKLKGAEEENGNDEECHTARYHQNLVESFDFDMEEETHDSARNG